MINIKNFRIFAMKHSPAKKRIAGVIPAFLFMPYATTSSLGSTIFSGIWNVILGLFKSIFGGLGQMFDLMMSGFGQSVVTMFQSFGFSMSGYGLWAPVMFVVGLGLAVMVGFLFFTFIDAEKDVTGFENDL